MRLDPLISVIKCVTQTMKNLCLIQDSSSHRHVLKILIVKVLMETKVHAHVPLTLKVYNFVKDSLETMSIISFNLTSILVKS